MLRLQTPPLQRLLPHWMDSASLRHHLRAALAVGSVVTLLHAAGLLGGLDGFMLRLIGSAGPAWRTASATPEALPVVALLGTQVYEHDFAQSSPLAPARLARLIGSVPTDPALRPAMVVIDLDVSPGPAESTSEAGRKALDDSLRRLLDAGVNVVLPLPIRVSTTDLQQLKFAWVRRLCNWNASGSSGQGQLAFGHTDILTHQGSVMQFDPGQPSIGVIAAGGGPGRPVCELALDASGRWSAPLVGSQYRNAELVLAISSQPAPLQSFNARFFAAEGRNVHVIQALDRPFQSSTEPLSVTGRVLFIGAGFNPQDRFFMPIEGSARAVEGVVVHAATYYSVMHPVTVPSGLAAYALDVILGVLMGYLFTFCWNWHLGVRTRHTEHAGLAAHWLPRGSLLANFLIAGVVAAFTLLLADLFFFPLNLWVNPVPIVLGVFAKFVLASHAHHSKADAGNRHVGHDHGQKASP